MKIMNLDALELLYGSKKEETEELSDREIFKEEPISYEENFPVQNEAYAYVTEEPSIISPEIQEEIHEEVQEIIQETIQEPIQENIVESIDEVQVINTPTFKVPEIKVPKFNFPSLSLKNIKIFSELKILIILFFVVFSAFFFFTNAKLVMITVNDVIWDDNSNTGILVQDFEEHTSADLTQDRQDKLLALEENFESLKQNQREKQEMTIDMQEFLDQSQESHGINFNILPPSNRLIIPDLNVNIPLIDIPAVWEADFENENFEEELTHGAVKYPTTAEPWEQGNTLIFWHSSTEWWKHNEYGFVFRNLPKLKEEQKIQVLWNGQLTTYEMVERKVVKPKEVEDYYLQFQKEGESYLTLMGCYPIWSNAQRIMIVAKKVNTY